MIIALCAALAAICVFGLYKSYAFTGYKLDTPLSRQRFAKFYERTTKTPASLSLYNACVALMLLVIAACADVAYMELRKILGYALEIGIRYIIVKSAAAILFFAIAFYLSHRFIVPMHSKVYGVIKSQESSD